MNKSPSAGQRIFFPIRAVSKAGNTYSIPPLSKLSAGEKSLAASSRQFNQRFQTVHNFVVFYFHFRYCLFKTEKYLNNRKVAEAVSRSLSTP